MFIRRHAERAVLKGNIYTQSPLVRVLVRIVYYFRFMLLLVFASSKMHRDQLARSKPASPLPPHAVLLLDTIALYREHLQSCLKAGTKSDKILRNNGNLT